VQICASVGHSLLVDQLGPWTHV